jgi:glutaconate CoA-transferase subunit A
MIDKRAELSELLPWIKTGHTLALGGMTLYRRPVSFVRALILQPAPPQHLTLLAFTGGLASDMLVGAGLISRVRSCYFGLETFGLAPMFTKMAGTPELTIIEESEASIACGIRAQLAKVGFMPSRAWQGTDMLQVRPDVKTITDPYTGKLVTAFPAIPVDVAVIHVLQADFAGNCILGGNPTIDADLAYVADKVIITAEEVVKQLPGPVDIPEIAVDAVVAQPQGAWPTSCYPLYPLDGQAILAYIDACNENRLASLIQEWS